MLAGTLRAHVFRRVSPTFDMMCHAPLKRATLVRPAVRQIWLDGASKVTETNTADLRKPTYVIDAPAQRHHPLTVNGRVTPLSFWYLKSNQFLVVE